HRSATELGGSTGEQNCRQVGPYRLIIDDSLEGLQASAQESFISENDAEQQYGIDRSCVMKVRGSVGRIPRLHQEPRDQFRITTQGSDNQEPRNLGGEFGHSNGCPPLYSGVPVNTPVKLLSGAPIVS